MAAAFVAGYFSYTVSHLGAASRPVLTSEQILAQSLRDQRQSALRDLLADELQLFSGWRRRGGQKDGHDGSEAAAQRRAKQRAGARSLAEARARAAEQADAADARYEKIYGKASRYAAAARSPLVSTGQENPGSAAGGKVIRGTVMQARLVNELASSPPQATAIATLSAPATFGSCILPVGTQVHGTVRGSGNSDTRLYVDFTFARLLSGETFSLSAAAADRQGREGIVGKRHVSAASLGSVGLAAASSAGMLAGRTLAGGLGGILGAGLEGATAASGEKMGRLDRDDDVIVVPKHTPIRIYVREFRLDSS